MCAQKWPNTHLLLVLFPFQYRPVEKCMTHHQFSSWQLSLFYHIVPVQFYQVYATNWAIIENTHFTHLPYKSSRKSINFLWFRSVQWVDVCMREMKNKSNQFNLEIIRISSTKLMFLILFSTLHLPMLFAFKSPFEYASELLFCAHNRCTIVLACNFNEMTFQCFFSWFVLVLFFFIRVYFKVCQKTYIECDFDCIVQW